MPHETINRGKALLTIVLTPLLALVGYAVAGIGALVQVLFLGSAVFFGWRSFWSRYALIAAATSSLALVLGAAVSPEFRDAIGPNTLWSSPRLGIELGFPAPLLFFACSFALPALIAGGITAKAATNRTSVALAHFGIMLGCWWWIHFSSLIAHIYRASATFADQGELAAIEVLDGSPIVRVFLTAEYAFEIHGGPLSDLVVSSLPLLCALPLLWVGNRLGRQRCP